MERYLRPLAIAVVIVEVCVALLTLPAFYVYLYFIGFRQLAFSPLTIQTLTITGLTLTFIMGVLAAVIAAQRGDRSWSIAFVVLLALFAYSPLFLVEVTQSPGFLANSATFNLNTPIYTLVALSDRILPAIILAVVVLIYNLRYRSVSAQGQDAAMETERGQIQ